MAIIRDKKNRIVFVCDSVECNDTLNTERTMLEYANKVAYRMGWRSVQDDTGTWHKYCYDCHRQMQIDRVKA
jgi:hypothetical protein